MNTLSNIHGERWYIFEYFPQYDYFSLIEQTNNTYLVKEFKFICNIHTHLFQEIDNPRFSFSPTIFSIRFHILFSIVVNNTFFILIRLDNFHGKDLVEQSPHVSYNCHNFQALIYNFSILYWLQIIKRL